jgi:hypothetical protein
MQNDFFWSIGIQAVGFGESPQTNAFAFDEKVNYAIFDSGSSHIMLPPSVFEPFIRQLLAVLGNPKYV